MNKSKNKIVLIKKLHGYLPYFEQSISIDNKGNILLNGNTGEKVIHNIIEYMSIRWSVTLALTDIIEFKFEQTHDRYPGDDCDLEWHCSYCILETYDEYDARQIAIKNEKASVAKRKRTLAQKAKKKSARSYWRTRVI